MRHIYWWLWIVLLSLRSARNLGLGDHVWYQGERWMLIQGVCCPCWDLAPIAVTDRRFPKHIHEREFRKVKSLPNYWHSFRSSYRFRLSHRPWINKAQ